MSMQYISDSVGKTTGVFIPIDEWNKLKDKYQGLEHDAGDDIPEWHRELVLKRMADAKANPASMLNWDDVIKELGSHE